MDDLEGTIRLMRKLLERHEEMSRIDEECGQDYKWTPRFRKLMADTRAFLSRPNPT